MAYGGKKLDKSDLMKHHAAIKRAMVHLSDVGEILDNVTGELLEDSERRFDGAGYNCSEVSDAVEGSYDKLQRALAAVFEVVNKLGGPNET
jgi:hypothetical protein